MLLSIIGNILGDDGSGGSQGNDTSGNELAGSISEEELLPGANSSGSAGGDDSAGSDDDIFGDSGDNDEEFGGGDDFLDNDEEFDDGDDFLEEDGEFGGGDDLLDGGMDDDGGMSMDAGEETNYSSEIEARVEEMENDVGSLVSTVNTVQGENEQINESLEDIEENIRKLLEVYEMVTQGVNPFVEEDSLSDTFGQGPGTGDFGGQSLFDSETDEQADEEIDEDIASAEAEAFLDEDVIDDGFEDDGFEDDDFDDDGFDDLEDDSEDTASDDDLSFDDLKEEYESGDAQWDESDTEDEAFDDELEDDTEAFDDELEESVSDDVTAETAFEEGSDEDDEAGTDAVKTDDALETAPAMASSLPWDDGGRPYLERVPSEYDTEFIVMDWLDYLVGEAGIDGAAETIELYGSLGWLGEPVCSYLKRLLNGFDGGPDLEDLEAQSSLGIDHARSLWWIEQISTPTKRQPPYDDWLDRKTTPTVGVAEVGTDEAEFRYTDQAIESDGESFDSDLEAEDNAVAQTAPGAQKIAIGETSEDGATESLQATVDTEGGGMIWVDSDVVLSDSGVELQMSQDGADDERPAQSSIATNQEPTFEWGEESVKPLIDPNDEHNLEPWKLDLVQSLLAPSGHDEG